MERNYYRIGPNCRPTSLATGLTQPRYSAFSRLISPRDRARCTEPPPMYAYFRRTPKFRPRAAPRQIGTQPRIQAAVRQTKADVSHSLHSRSLSLSFLYLPSLYPPPPLARTRKKGRKRWERGKEGRGAMKSVPTRGRSSGRLAGLQGRQRQGKAGQVEGSRLSPHGARESLRYTPSRIHPRPIPDLPELFFP